MVFLSQGQWKNLSSNYEKQKLLLWKIINLESVTLNNQIQILLSFHCNNFRLSIVRVFNKINILPGSVACLEGGGVNTEAGPGVFRGCLATCRAEITTAWDPWYLKENFILNSFTKMLLIVLCQSVFFFKRTCP